MIVKNTGKPIMKPEQVMEKTVKAIEEITADRGCPLEKNKV